MTTTYVFENAFLRKAKLLLRSFFDYFNHIDSSASNLALLHGSIVGAVFDMEKSKVNASLVRTNENKWPEKIGMVNLFLKLEQSQELHQF